MRLMKSDLGIRGLVEKTLPRALRPFIPVLVALALVAVAGLGVLGQIALRTDMAVFLPPGSTPATEFLFRELRSGAATTLVLVGIENAPPEELAAISQAMADDLRKSDLFAFIGNGSGSFAGAEQNFLFEHRYLLSGLTRPETFTIETLHEKLESVLTNLNSSAAPLFKRYALADPVGAFFDVVKNWIGASRIEQRSGVWFAADRPRALLIAKTKVAGFDPEAQRPALDAIATAFARAQSGGAARLLVSGPAVFARDAASAIRADTHLVAAVSGILIAVFLLWRYRSPLILAAIAVPLGISIIAAALAVQLVFGFVHGITLGFGMTMLGVTVDYPILLIGLRRPEEKSWSAARRIWPTMMLAVATAALGLTGMLFSSFPGLAQLGLFSVIGLVTAAAVARWILPLLVPPLPARPPLAGLLSRYAEGLRRRRLWLALPIVLAAGYLLVSGGPRWESDIANLSPVPQEKRDLDAELRREIAAPDVRYLVALHAGDAEGVLQAAERLDGTIAELTGKGAIGGAELVSRYLPSRKTQLARQAALPDPADLAERLDKAGAGLPFRARAFQPFIDAVARTRAMEPLTRRDIDSPAMAARIDALLFTHGGEWYGLVALVDMRDPAAVAAAIGALADPAMAYIDIKDETDRLVAGYTAVSLWAIAAGALAVLLILAAALRRPLLVLRVALPIAGAAVVTLGVLAALQIPLTIFHLVSLLLMGGVSLDYALFLNRMAMKGADGARVLGAVATCNVTTLLTFGLLAFCHTPILRSIGVTVAVGVFCGLVFSYAFSADATEAE